jgi:hypothetical protein
MSVVISVDTDSAPDRDFAASAKSTAISDGTLALVDPLPRRPLRGSGRG